MGDSDRARRGLRGRATDLMVGGLERGMVEQSPADRRRYRLRGWQCLHRRPPVHDDLVGRLGWSTSLSTPPVRRSSTRARSIRVLQPDRRLLHGLTYEVLCIGGGAAQRRQPAGASQHSGGRWSSALKVTLSLPTGCGNPKLSHQ